MKYRKTTLHQQTRVLDSVVCPSERQLDAEEGNKLYYYSFLFVATS